MVDHKSEVARPKDAVPESGRSATASPFHSQIYHHSGKPETSPMAEATKKWPEMSGALRPAAVQDMHVDGLPPSAARGRSGKHEAHPKDESRIPSGPEAKSMSHPTDAGLKGDAPATDAAKQTRIENAQKVLSNPNASPQDKLAAAAGAYHDLPKDSHGDAAIKLQDGDKERQFHIQISKAGGGRSLINAYGTDDKGHERIAFRGIQNKDGSFEQQQASPGSPASFEGSWWKQHMQGSTVGQTGKPGQTNSPESLPKGVAPPPPEAQPKPVAPPPPEAQPKLVAPPPPEVQAPIPLPRENPHRTPAIPPGDAQPKAPTVRPPDAPQVAPRPESHAPIEPKPAPKRGEPIGPVHHGLVSNYGGPEDQGSGVGGDRGSTTASGEPFNPDAMTAASRDLPFGTRVKVTDPSSGKSVTVTINDRGPFHRAPGHHGKRGPYDRDLDLSYGAAQALGRTGTPKVQWQVLAN